MSGSPAHKTPWGSWEVLLEAPYCKVKRIIVDPEKRCSLQKHFKRCEVWTVVQGVATVTLGDDVSDYPEGSVIQIATEEVHRVANLTSSPVVFIEVQRGTYFGEDDIVRLEDDFGR